MDSEIIKKIENYCSYQERCKKEVVEKLFKLNVDPLKVDDIINYLNKNNYLNEERYVKLFIQGKLRIKKWGKIKLKYELKIRGIDKNIIHACINEISDTDYISYFNEFSMSKIKSLKGNQAKKKRSFINYFSYRGWENDLIYKKIKEIN